MKTYFYILLTIFLAINAEAKERDTIDIDKNLYKNSSIQLDYLFEYNKLPSSKNWYIFFMGANVDELKYIIQASQYNEKYNFEKLLELNEKLIKINERSNDYEVYAALTDFNKVLKVTSLFKTGKELNDHIEEIENQLSNLPINSIEQEQLNVSKYALKKFSDIRKSILDSIYNSTTNFKNSTKRNHFLPFVMNITYEELANVDGDASKKQFFSWGMYPKKNDQTVNSSYLNQLYARFKTDPDKSNIYKFSEAQIASVIDALDLYINLPDINGLNEGIGQEIYQLYSKDIQENSKEQKDLIELANFLTENYKGEKFIIDNNCQTYNCEIGEDLIEVISKKNIKSLKEFNEAFPYKGLARDYKDGKNTFVNYYSYINLWESLDSSSYNAYSHDYVLEDNGIKDKYHYSLKDLLVRYDVFNSPEFAVMRGIIIETEKSGQASPISNEEFYDQYTHKYETNSAVYFIAEWSARLAEAPLAAYMAQRIVAEYGAFVVKELIKILGDKAFYQLLKEPSKNALQGAAIEYGVQATFNYILNENIATFKEAAKPENINWASVAWAAGENTIKYRKSLTELVVSGTGACLVNGFTDVGGLRDEFSYKECAFNVTTTFVLKGIFKVGASPHLRKQAADALKEGIDKLKSLLTSKGIPEDKVDDFIESIQKSVDDGDNVTPISNSWDDIVVKGKNGVKEAITDSYKTIDEFLESPMYSTKVSDDFVKYKGKGGKLDFDKYTIKHKVITKNRMQGKIAEDTFEYLEKGFRPERGIRTSDGVRYMDNIYDGTAREIKSGIVKLTEGIKRQVKKDIEILLSDNEFVYKIEWHALDGIEDNTLKFIREEMLSKGLDPAEFKIVIY